MNLKTQIISLIFSFLFGIFFYMGLELHESIFKTKRKIIQLIGSFLYVLVNTLIYFLLIKKINHAIFHPYELFMIIFGYIIGFYLLKYIKAKYGYSNPFQKK